jgi:hypothetical protein
MAWIHHPALDVDAEVPDDTVDIWCGEPGWRPGTRENPEPWSPPQQLDENGDPIHAPENSEPTADPAPSSKRRTGTPAATSVPVGDPTTTPDTED